MELLRLCKKIASIDVGEKRIGLAFFINGVSLPQDAIFRKNRDQASRDLLKVLNEWDINTLIVGIPKDSSDYEVMKKKIEHFVGLLKFDGEVFYQDESFSSFEAKESMKGNIKQKRDGKIDSISAKIILERWVSDNL
jgi:putative Holliday junction resolvase